VIIALFAIAGLLVLFIIARAGLRK